VVVKKLAAFIERYPAVSLSLVAGEFTGSLENSGERITLLDATDASIRASCTTINFRGPSLRMETDTASS
jgi:hypothetical protein